MFVQKGKDVLLKGNETIRLTDTTDFYWKFNAINNVLKFDNNNRLVIYDNYKGRVDFHKEHFSLTLKNLQQNDSGNYVAVVSGNKDVPAATYEVLVQGRFLILYYFDYHISMFE